MLQFSFEDVAYQSRTKKTRNQRFLEQMDAVLPWEAFLSGLISFSCQASVCFFGSGLATWPLHPL